MAWIPSHQTLRDHRKVKRAARQLGISIPTLIGHLHLLWWWALDQAPDGDLTICDPWDIAEAMLFEGDPAILLEVLLECGGTDGFGFLERTDEDRLMIHDWADYGGKYLAKKEQTRARVTRYRAKCNAPVTQKKRVQIECNADVTHLEESREDKKRGEKSTERESVAAPPPRAPKFVSPTALETATFFTEEGSSKKQAKLYFEYYTANGWKVGRNPMKDWKAAARGWIAREADYSNGHADKSSDETRVEAMTQRTEDYIERLKREPGVPLPADMKGMFRRGATT